MRLLALIAFVALTLPSCGSPSQSARADHSVALHVVATFSTLASLVAAVGGERVAVTSFVPVGASPEDYQPTPRDVATLESADALVENGIIEAWLDHLLSTAKGARARRLVLSDGIPLRDGNPHLWMDPAFARVYVQKIAALLASLDPAGASHYRSNARAYDARLRILQADIARQIATIPPPQRTMLVFHNAWQYYNDRFG
ncbi:MAG: metal ABC transporter substrate-binding protein, partial [Candidatus Baltobacteraceae bacterium]